LFTPGETGLAAPFQRAMVVLVSSGSVMLSVRNYLTEKNVRATRKNERSRAVPGKEATMLEVLRQLRATNVFFVFLFLRNAPSRGWSLSPKMRQKIPEACAGCPAKLGFGQ